MELGQLYSWERLSLRSRSVLALWAEKHKKNNGLSLPSNFKIS